MLVQMRFTNAVRAAGKNDFRDLSPEELFAVFSTAIHNGYKPTTAVTSFVQKDPPLRATRVTVEFPAEFWEELLAELSDPGESPTPRKAPAPPSANSAVRDTIGPSKFLRDIRLTELPGMPHVKMLQNRAVATVGGFLDLTRKRMIGGIPELALYNIFLWMIQQNLMPDPKITDMAGSASIFSSAIMIMRLERIDDMSIIRTLKSSYPHLDWQAYGL